MERASGLVPTIQQATSSSSAIMFPPLEISGHLCGQKLNTVP